MKQQLRYMSSLVLSALIGFMLMMPQSIMADSSNSAKNKMVTFSEIVDTDFVAQYAVIPVRQDAVIIDSRPTRKYNKGHIVPAINIPNTTFGKSTHLLPSDKSVLLVFYCGGLKCPLSHKSAFQAQELGYSNIKVYAEGYPAWISKGNIPGVSAKHVKKLIDKNAGALIVDARPKRKFKKGHVPTAVNIPWTNFDDKVGMLPPEKNTPIIYYCGGLKCTLSTKSATKAVSLGYTNVSLFQPGWPAWKKAYGNIKSGNLLQTTEEEGMLTLTSFQRLIKEAPDSVYLIDVRDREEVKSDGTFKKARVLPVDELEEGIAELPSDKPIVFFCSTGARSGEAYDMVRAEREDLKVYFLDANVEFANQEFPRISPPD